MFCLKQTYQGFAPTRASRHCEERSNPENMNYEMAAAATPVYAPPLDCFVVPPRNDAKRLSDAKRR